MKYLLLFVIKIYWKLIPASKRCRCIFRESCSNHVFRITETQGLFKGVAAFKLRLKNCKPGYVILKDNDEILLITANNKVFHESEIRLSLIK